MGDAECFTIPETIHQRRHEQAKQAGDARGRDDPGESRRDQGRRGAVAEIPNQVTKQMRTEQTGPGPPKEGMEIRCPKCPTVDIQCSRSILEREIKAFAGK